jgi:uncharacterized GH25 family protein
MGIVPFRNSFAKSLGFRELRWPLKLRYVSVAILLLFPALLLAHDTWLVPATFFVASGTSVKVRLATSEAFPISDSPMSPDRIALFKIRTMAGTGTGSNFRAEANYLVTDVTHRTNGHVILIVETKPRAFVLEPKIFNEYITEEHAQHVLDARAAAGKTNTPGRERYRKITKSILCVGNVGKDDLVYTQPNGLWLEILLEASTCSLRAGSSLKVRVLLDGKPFAGKHLVAGYEGVKGHKYPVDVMTDAGGYATVKLDRAGVWFLRAHHIVPTRNDPESDWESAFSTLTFEVGK